MKHLASRSKLLGMVILPAVLAAGILAPTASATNAPCPGLHTPNPPARCPTPMPPTGPIV